MCDSEFEESRTSPKHGHQQLGGGAFDHDGAVVIPPCEIASAALASVSLMDATQNAIADTVAGVVELHCGEVGESSDSPSAGNFNRSSGGGAGGPGSGPGGVALHHRNYFVDLDEGGFWISPDLTESTCPVAVALDWCQNVEKKIESVTQKSCSTSSNSNSQQVKPGTSVGRKWAPGSVGGAFSVSFSNSLSPPRIIQGSEEPFIQHHHHQQQDQQQRIADPFATSIPFKSSSSPMSARRAKAGTTSYSSADESSAGQQRAAADHPLGHLRFGCCVDRTNTSSTGASCRRHACSETLTANLAFVVSCAFSCPVIPLREVFQDVLGIAAMNDLLPENILRRLERENQVVVSAPAAASDSESNHDPAQQQPLPPWRPSAVLLATSRHIYNSAVGLLYFGPNAALWNLPTTAPADHQVQQRKRRAIDRLTTCARIFGRNGELPNFMGAMAIFPGFLTAHEDTMQFLFFGDGPLRIPERLMIGVMCAARHRSEYLVRYFASLLVTATATSGGEDYIISQGWLEHGPPEKLAALQPLIALAAHKPWTITAEAIETLTERKGWSMQELAHAMSITSTVLSLCSFCGGVLVSNDVQTDCLLPAFLLTSPLKGSPVRSTVSPGPEGEPESTNGSSSCKAPSYSIYVGNDTIQSESRIGKAAKGSEGAAISESSFSWANDGAPTLEELYEGFSTRFNTELAEARNLPLSVKNPEGRFCRPGDDPMVAWRALRLYILNILGIVVDEFNYAEINKRLSYGAKRFAQKTVVNPERLLPSEIFSWKFDAPQASTSSVSSSPLVDNYASYHLATTTPSQPLPTSPFPPGSSNSPSASFPDQHQFLRSGGSDRAGNSLAELQEELLVLAVSVSTMMARRETLLTIFMSKVTEYFRR